MPSTIRRSGPVSPAVELVAAVREGYHPRQAGTVVRFEFEFRYIANIRNS